MGDMTEGFREMTRERKERHAKWHERNRAIIEAANLRYTDKGEALLFREKNKPKSDFYPSTGRWKVGNQVYRGGAIAFLEWYRKQGDTP